MSYGNGVFYKDIPQPKYRFDINPQTEDVEEGDSRGLPLERESINSCVFDPPFLTYIKKGRKHNSIMAKRFSGYYSYDELEDHYRDSISEAYRILAPKGKLVFKCQDIIHNHKLQATHINVTKWAELEGFRLCDLFILTAKHRMPMPQRGTQKHARIYHSYFLVLERNR